MVIVKIRAGLENQMFLYAAARMLQEQIGGGLCLDFSEYGINDFGKPDHEANYEKAFRCLNLAEYEVIFDCKGNRCFCQR